MLKKLRKFIDNRAKLFTIKEATPLKDKLERLEKKKMGNLFDIVNNNNSYVVTGIVEGVGVGFVCGEDKKKAEALASLLNSCDDCFANCLDE